MTTQQGRVGEKLFSVVARTFLTNSLKTLQMPKAYRLSAEQDIFSYHDQERMSFHPLLS